MNKKLTKLLTVFLLAGSVGMGAVGATGCHKHNYDEDHWVATADGSQHGHKAACHDAYKDVEDHVDADNNGKCDKCGEDMPGYTPPGATSTVSSVTVAVANDVKTIYVGKTVQLSATVNGTGNPAQTVTWSSSDTNKATVDANGLVTGAAAGTVEITATSTADDNVSGKVSLTIKDVPAIPANESDRAIVPTYTDKAAGPVDEVRDRVIDFDAADLPGGTALEEDYNDGIFSIPKSTSLRLRDALDPADATGQTKLDGYTRSVQNGTITINVPAAGKLTFYYSSGSSTVGNAGYKITGGSQSGDTVTINTKDKILQVLEIPVTKGKYTFSTGKGTVDVYKMKLELTQVQSTEIETLDILSAGTTDYLVTQKVDCMGVKLIAKDKNSIPYEVSLANCKFDTSKYNPNMSGEYEIGVTYYLASNLNGGDTEISTSYKVKVYAVNSITLGTVGLSGSSQVSVQQAYLTTDTYAKDNNITVMATCDLDGEMITYKLKKDWYTITDSLSLSTAGKKTVTVSVNDNYTLGNKEVKATYEVVSAAKKTVENNKVTVTVGESGEFSTVTQAVQYLKKCNYEDTVEKIIEIAPGTYTEKIWIDVNNVTLVGKGANADATSITYSLVEGDEDNLSGALWALYCATVHVTGKNFKAYNLAIRNDFDYINNSKNYSGSQAAQGVALTLDTDGAVIANCHLYGNQDTLYMKSGRSYYYKTQIDGNVDFIFGGSTGIAYFDECKIVAINRTAVDATTGKGKAQNGYVTAAQHDKDSKKPDYGYVFYKCEMTDDGKVADGAMSLGRSWGNCATIAYIECSFSAAYSKLASTANGNDHRWSNWSGGTAAADADFKEFGSTGDGAITSAVTGGSIINAATAALHTKANTFAKQNGGVSYAESWNCDAALVNLYAQAAPQLLVTLTINDTDGDKVCDAKVVKGYKYSPDELVALINEGLTGDTEVKSLYTAYTSDTVNTPVEAAAYSENGTLIAVTGAAYVDPIKTYNLLDYTGATIQGSSSVVTDIGNGILVDARNGKFDNRSSRGNNDVQVNKGTIIYVPMAGNYKVTINSSSTLSESAYTIQYVDYEGGHYAKITMGDSANSYYLTTIVVDSTQTVS